MGKRVHVVKKKEEYAGIEAFNWKMEEFKDLLNALDCNVCGEEYGDRFDVPADDDKQAMKYLKDINNGKMLVEIDVEDVKDAINALDYGTIDEIIETMNLFWKYRDKKSDWLIFVAW